MKWLRALVDSVLPSYRLVKADYPVRILSVYLNPGDVLVVRCPGLLTAQQADGIRSQLQSLLGEGQKIVILDGGLSLDVVRQREIAHGEAANTQA